MKHSEEIVFETFVGRDRTPLQMTRSQYDEWLDNIRQDEDLMFRVKQVLSGHEPMQDLDEGKAGIFPQRVFPYADAIGAKLGETDARTRHVILAALLHQVLTDLSSH